MSSTTASYLIAGLTLYALIVTWWRERRPAIHMLPIALTTLQAFVVIGAIFATKVVTSTPLDSNDYQALIVSALLPVPLLQVLLVARRKPAVFRGIPYVTVVFVIALIQLALAPLVIPGTPLSLLTIVICLLAVGTIVSTVLILTNRIGPAPQRPAVDVFD